MFTYAHDSSCSKAIDFKSCYANALSFAFFQSPICCLHMAYVSVKVKSIIELLSARRGKGFIVQISNEVEYNMTDSLSSLCRTRQRGATFGCALLFYISSVQKFPTCVAKQMCFKLRKYSFFQRSTDLCSKDIILTIKTFH